MKKWTCEPERRMGLGLGVVKLGSKSRDLARRVVFALVVALVEITKTAKNRLGL